MEEGHPHSFLKSHPYGILPAKEAVRMKTDIERLREKYMENPPEGMTSGDIRHMSGDDLLDMDYFLNEDDEFDDEFGEEDLSPVFSGGLSLPFCNLYFRAQKPLVWILWSTPSVKLFSAPFSLRISQSHDVKSDGIS